MGNRIIMRSYPICDVCDETILDDVIYQYGGINYCEKCATQKCKNNPEIIFIRVTLERV